MKKLRISFLAVGILFFLIVGDSIVGAQTTQTIKMGAILDFTGPLAHKGPLYKNGIVKALEEVNYTIAGRKIELIPEDTGGTANSSLEKARKLAERDNVHIIIGPIMGDAQMAIAPYIAGKKVICTSLNCGLRDLIKYKNWFIYPTTTETLTIPVGYFAADLGYKTMITGGADYAGGHIFIAAIKNGFEEKGGKVVQQIWYPVGNVDFSSYLSSFKKADCFAYFVEVASGTQRLISQYHEFGIKVPLLGTHISNQLVEKVLANIGDICVGLKGQAHYIPTSQTPLNQKWVKEMINRFGQMPGADEQSTYAITQALLTALKSTNGDDSFDKLWPALSKVKMESPQGLLSVSPEGVAITDNYIVEVKKREGKYYLDPIKTYRQVMDPTLKK